MENPCSGINHGHTYISILQFRMSNDSNKGNCADLVQNLRSNRLPC